MTDLTPAQERALLWFPENMAWTKPPRSLTSALISLRNAGKPGERFCEVDWGRKEWARGRYYRITSAGIAARKQLEADRG